MSYNLVVLADVVRVDGSGKTDSKIIQLSRVPISTDPVRTEPVMACACQSYTAAGSPPFPFAMEMLASIRLESPPTRMPELQFVAVVTPMIVLFVLAFMRIPCDRKRWTTPGPWILTPVWFRIRMPCSGPVALLPPQAVCASAWPVRVQPFSSSVTLDDVMSRQGAFVTVQVTSPTKRLSSLIFSVCEMG